MCMEMFPFGSLGMRLLGKGPGNLFGVHLSGIKPRGLSLLASQLQVFPFIIFPNQVSQHNHAWVFLISPISTKQIHPQSQMAAACPDKQEP